MSAAAPGDCGGSAAGTVRAREEKAPVGSTGEGGGRSGSAAGTGSDGRQAGHSGAAGRVSGAAAGMGPATRSAVRRKARADMAVTPLLVDVRSAG